MDKEKWKSRFHQASEVAKKFDAAATKYSNTHDPAAVLVGHSTRKKKKISYTGFWGI